MGWWITGFIALGIIALIFMKLRTASHHIQMVNAAQNHLRISFRLLNIFDAQINPRVWNDAYLLGYAQGSIAIMTQVFGGKLSAQQKGMVVVDALRGLVGDRYIDVCALISELHEQHHPEFERGMSHGGDVAILMSNRPGPALLADPDVQAALREAPVVSQQAATILGSADTGAFGTAGGVLMQTHMHRHKEAAGY